MELGLKGQYVLVTGSSRGIGRGLAEAFLKEEANVILTGRDDFVLKEAVEILGAGYGSKRVLSFNGDLQHPDILTSLKAFILKEIGFLDHLICNIGSGKSVPPLQEDRDEFQRMLDINLMGAVESVREMLPLIEKSVSEERASNSIIFTGSICGIETLGCPVAYASAKSAMVTYAKNIARPLGQRGIRVNVVSPGNIIFSGSTWEDKLAQDKAAVEAMLEREVPLSRLGTVEEIADVVVFLASERAGFVSGANWVVDGGQTR